MEKSKEASIFRIGGVMFTREEVRAIQAINETAAAAAINKIITAGEEQDTVRFQDQGASADLLRQTQGHMIALTWVYTMLGLINKTDTEVEQEFDFEDEEGGKVDARQI
jgi:hypothetical protein